MTRDRELWACANLLVERHEEDAPLKAALRIDELDELGDRDGADTWRMILDRIFALITPPAGQSN